VTRIKSTFGFRHSRCNPANQFDEFLIGVNDRWTTFPHTRPQFDPHRLGSTNMDVAHFVIFQQRLKTTEPKHLGNNS
jgi:hypothetical protein